MNSKKHKTRFWKLKLLKLLKTERSINILLKGVTKAIEIETKGGFLGMLLGTLGASLLGNMLTGK